MKSRYISASHFIFKIVFVSFLTYILLGCSPRSDEIQITPLIPEEQAFDYGVAENIEEVECEFGNRDNDDDGPDVNAECGYLTVPEDRNEPDGKKIRLPYTILKGTGPETLSDPLVILFSNPSPVLDFAFQFRYFFGAMLANRDIIILEQRGVGGSEPNLDCPDVERIYEADQAESPGSEAITQEILDGFQACRQKLLNDGVNLDVYTTAESAADLEDLRQALGIKQWNLFGVGYGTNLALELMDRYPGSVRSAILESPILLESFSLENQAVYSQASLDAFFKRCAEDSQCNAAFPNLEDIFYQQVDQLNASPVTLEVTDIVEGSRYNYEMDGDRLLEYALSTLDNGYEGTLSELPRAIYNLSLGKTTYLANLLGNDYGFGPDGQILSGIQLNIYCRASTAKSSKSSQDTTAIRPQVWEFLSKDDAEFHRLCEVWNVEPDKESQQEYRSSVPALILAGEFSYSTPVQIARQLAGFLPRSTLVEFPGAGVFPTGSQTWADCARQLEKQLLEQPGSDLDTSCADEEKNLLWITIP